MHVSKGARAATWGVFTGLLVLLPGVAALATVGAYMLLPADQRGFSWLVPVIGIALAFVGMLLTAAIAKSFGTVSGANAAMAMELAARLASLKADADAYCTKPTKDEDVAACAKTREYITFISERITPTGDEPAGIDWTSGAGYVGLWQAMHRAEEAILMVAPDAVVIASSQADQARLRGSSIAGQRLMLGTSRVAVEVIAGGKVDNTLAAAIGVPTNLDVQTARGLLAGTRKVVNEYRDDLSLGLVQLRRRLNLSVLFIGLSGFAALALMMIGGLEVKYLVTGMAYYLIGVFIGVLPVAYSERNMKSQVSDFGVSFARMTHIALISGVAAVAGVGLAAMIIIKPLGLSLLDEPPASMANLLWAFDFARYPAAIVAAAVFGLTPGLLFKRLKEAGNSMTLGLEKSSAGTGEDDEEEES